MGYHRDSEGAFDITVGPLMKAWGFFRGEGRVPTEDELAAARRHVGGSHVILNPIEVPEPAAISLIGFGALLLCWMGKRVESVR